MDHGIRLLHILRHSNRRWPASGQNLKTLPSNSHLPTEIHHTLQHRPHSKYYLKYTPQRWHASMTCTSRDRKMSEGAIWPKVRAWSFFDVNCIFYHVTRLLAEFGMKCTPLVAWEVAQPLFLAYFGINSPRMPSTRPNHTSFYPKNTINVLLICCLSRLDVETQVWRGLDFDPFWHPFCWFFKGNAPKMHISSTTGFFSLQLFCNDVCLLQEHQKTKNHVIWCSGWSGVDIWLWKLGFMPRPIAHGRRDGYLSSSGAMKSLHAGIPSNSKLVRYPSRRPYPGIMPKAYPFWASDSPSGKMSRHAHSFSEWEDVNTFWSPEWVYILCKAFHDT